MAISRRRFLKQASTSIALCASPLSLMTLTPNPKAGKVMTVAGEIAANKLGVTLPHEHILVDFIGANQTGYHRWSRPSVIREVLPHLKKLNNLGCQSLIECTPAYLGRDPLLLREISQLTGLNIITNTGYYGARKNQHIPQHGFTETADQLSARWIKEWEDGIDGTGIRPGFMKIGVDRGGLSELHQKLVRAAARTHLQTGLPIYIHTGPALAAFQEMDILEEEGVELSAYTWVHAQVEQDMKKRIEAAERGAWVSLDGFSSKQTVQYVDMLNALKAERLLHRVLLSHDAGWYTPGEPNGGNYQGHTEIFEYLLPELREQGYTEKEIKLLIVQNPANAMTIKIRKK